MLMQRSNQLSYEATDGEHHHVINCVQKTMTIQVFFKKIVVSGDFHSSLNLLRLEPSLRKIIEATHQDIKKLWCGVFRSKQTLLHSISLPD